ncbi:MAG: hypothetical protein LBD11_01570 [Candidatus Peribacteria bacterium]|jgi:hypothetical protein|nr:hypothetical protein [Candidatus Peribacteria bacterium]
MVGFPLSAEEKYLMLLKKRGYSYRLFSVKDTIPQVVKSFEGTAPLACSEEDAISRFKQLSVPTSPEKPPVPSENSDFKAFLQELVVLLQKYSV